MLIVAGLLSLPGAVRAYDNGAPNSRMPTLGWSSWVALGPGNSAPIFDFCDEFSVKASADAFHEVGLYDAGYRHLHLDDCWAGGRNSSGYLYPEADHFPNGMKSVVDYVHAKNLTFGLYTCAGTETCVGHRPGSKDHWEQDAAVWAEWGVDWVKMDWCNTQGMDPISTYPLMSKALNASGRSIHFNMCEWGKENPWEWGYPVAQSWRMSQDHTGIWSSTKSQIQGSAAIPRNDSGKAFGWNDMDMLETGCYEQCAHANGKLSNMTATEYMTEFSMWAISASPLQFTSPIMNCTQPSPPEPNCKVTLEKQDSVSVCTEGTSFGCYHQNSSMYTTDGCRGEFTCNGKKVRCNVDGDGVHVCDCLGAPVTCKGWISDLQKKILLNTEVIAINQDVTPQGHPVKEGDLTVWARELSDGSFAVALYNQEDTVANLAVQFTDLGWRAGTSARVRDLWAHTDVGVMKDAYPSQGTVTVQPHETHLVRLYPQ